MKVYKKRKYWALYIYLFILVSVVGSTLVFLPSEYSNFKIPTISFIALQCFIILFLQWKRAKSKFITKQNSFITHNFLRNQEITFDEVIGYEIHNWQITHRPLRFILLKTYNTDYKAIKVHTSYHNFIELSKWIESNFTNLDQLKEKQQWENAKENTNYGTTPSDRSYFINRAKKVAKSLNFSAIILLPFIYFPATYSYILFPAIIIPILSIIAIYYFKGIIKLEQLKRYQYRISKNRKLKNENDSVKTDVFIALILSTMTLLSIVHEKYQIINHSDIWTIALSTSTLLFLLCIIRTRELQYNKIMSYLKLGLMFIVFYGYAYSSILGLNCALDYSKPLTEKSIITHKKLDNGASRTTFKSPRFFLKLNNPKLKKQITISVSEQVYQSVEIGSDFEIHLKKGLFNMTWMVKNK